MKKLWIIFALLIPFSAIAGNLKDLNDSMKHYISAGEFKSALPFALKAGIEVKKKGSNQKEIQPAIATIIDLYISLDMNDSALVYNRLDSSIIAKMPAKKRRSNNAVLYRFGLIYSSMRKFPDAERSFNELLAKPDIAKDSLTWGKTLFELGKIYAQKGNLIDAEKYLEKSFGIFSNVVDSTDLFYMNCLKSLGVVYRQRGKLLKASEIYRRDMLFKMELYGKNSREYAGALNSTALLYKTMGKLREAQTLYDKSIKIDKATFSDNSIEYAGTLNNIGALYSQMGLTREADNAFEKCLQIVKFHKAEDKPLYVFILNNYSRHLTNMGDYDRAKEVLKLALDAGIKIFGEKHPHSAIAMNNLSDLMIETGKYSEAYAYSQSALKIVSENKGSSPALRTVNLARNGNLLRWLGEFDKADSLFKETVKVMESDTLSTSLVHTTIKSNYAKLLTDKEQYQDALEIYKMCLDRNLKIYDPTNEIIALDYLHIGESYSHLNQKDSADLYYGKFIKMTIEILKNLFPYLNDVEKSNFLGASKNNFEIFNSYNLNQPPGNQNLALMYDNSLLFKGILLNSLKKLKEKIQESGDEELIDNYTTWQNKKDYLVKLVNLFEIENNEKRLLIDSLEKTVNDLEKWLQKTSNYFRDYINPRPIYWLDVQNALKDNEAALEIIRVNAYERNPNPHNPEVSNMGFADVAKYAVLILKKNAPIDIVVLENGNDLENSYLQKYKAQVAKSKEEFKTDAEKESIKKNEKEIRDVLQELFGHYFEKIYSKLGGIKKIYISPDGVYNQVNLNTLINPKTKKFIIDEIDIQLLTSTRALADAMIKSNKDNPMLQKPENMRDKTKLNAELFGDPIYWLDTNQTDVANKVNLTRSEEFTLMPRNITDAIIYTLEKNRIIIPITDERKGISQLPGTKIEVDSISGILGKFGWQSNPHLGTDALEEVVKMVDNPSVLHIATHGIFLDNLTGSLKNTSSSYNYSNDPMLRSMLLFSGAANSLTRYSNRQRVLRNEDGFLTALEAMNLKLDNTDLVVLSACETGLGEIRNGEGVYGLQRAFAAAGAKSIIMSLWNVSDEATQSLMRLFYEKWLNGSERHSAFRDAQLELKNRNPNIYLWGAFVFEGD